MVFERVHHDIADALGSRHIPPIQLHLVYVKNEFGKSWREKKQEEWLVGVPSFKLRGSVCGDDLKRNKG